MKLPIEIFVITLFTFSCTFKEEFTNFRRDDGMYVIVGPDFIVESNQKVNLKYLPVRQYHGDFRGEINFSNIEISFFGSKFEDSVSDTMIVHSEFNTENIHYSIFHSKTNEKSKIWVLKVDKYSDPLEDIQILEKSIRFYSCTNSENQESQLISFFKTIKPI